MVSRHTAEQTGGAAFSRPDAPRRDVVPLSHPFLSALAIRRQSICVSGCVIAEWTTAHKAEPSLFRKFSQLFHDARLAIQEHILHRSIRNLVVKSSGATRNAIVIARKVKSNASSHACAAPVRFFIGGRFRVVDPKARIPVPLSIQAT